MLFRSIRTPAAAETAPVPTHHDRRAPIASLPIVRITRARAHTPLLRPAPHLPSASVLLLSVRSELAARIARGEKRCELRRVPPDPARSRLVLVHACAPVAAIVCVCETLDVLRVPPRELWTIVGRDSLLPRNDFLAYFRGVRFAHAIRFAAIHPLLNPLSLQLARRLDPTYCAPQSYRYLLAESRLVRAVLRSARMLAPASPGPA